MSEIRPNCLYTKDHEWIRKSNAPKTIVMGITDFAQSSLGDVTFLQLADAGKSFKKGEVIGTVESVKAVSDIYAPMSGKISKRNDALFTDPSTINTKPFDDAWLVEIEISNETEFEGLLNPQAYEQIAQ